MIWNIKEACMFKKKKKKKSCLKTSHFKGKKQHKKAMNQSNTRYRAWIRLVMLLMQVEAPLEGNTLIRAYVYNTEILLLKYYWSDKIIFWKHVRTLYFILHFFEKCVQCLDLTASLLFVPLPKLRYKCYICSQSHKDRKPPSLEHKECSFSAKNESYLFHIN